MSTEVKQGEPQYLNELFKSYIDGYIEAGLIAKNDQPQIHETIELLFGEQSIVGLTIASLGELHGIDTSHANYNPDESQAAATLEGSIASIRSNQTSIKQQIESLLGVINQPIIDSEHENFGSFSIIPLGMLAILKSIPNVITPDGDIIFQIDDPDDMLGKILVDQLALLQHKFQLITHIYNNGTCKVHEIAGHSNGKNTLKADASVHPRSEKAKRGDKRTGRSFQEYIQHPLTIDESYRVIIEPNRRLNKIKNPEKAIGIAKDKELIAHVVMSTRDMRKKLESNRSRSIKTPIDDLISKQKWGHNKFITRRDIKKTRKLTENDFATLDDFTKISLMKEVVFMSELDLYAALWYLNVTHLDKHLLGHHFEDIHGILNILKGKNASIEEARGKYTKNQHHGYQRLIRAINKYCEKNSITLEKPMVTVKNKITLSLDPLRLTSTFSQSQSHSRLFSPIPGPLH